MTGTDDLNGHDPNIIAKLDRALALVVELQALQQSLRDERAEHEYESASNAVGDDTNPVVWMEWRLKKGSPTLPTAFSALLGDCIHNLRASLDYCTWAAASAQARSVHPTQVSFPLLDALEKFQRWRSAKAGWYGPKTVEVIDWAQPFHATDKLHPLKILQVLSNTDKHRLLNVVEYAHIDLGQVLMDPEPEFKLWTATSGPIAVGDVIGRVEFPRPINPHEITLVPLFGWYECVEYQPPGEATQWLQLDQMMTAVAAFVVDVVALMAGARKHDEKG